MVTMARACLYSLDENKKMKEERDEFLVLSTIDTINREQIMTANVIFGNHTSVIVPQHNRDNIRKFYCDVLGGEITKADDARDFIRLGEDFYIVLYGDVPDESEFLRTARSVWLEIKSDKVEEMRRKILESGLVRKLEVPDPHLYFQAPGGQCLRLVAIDEDLSFYEGAGAGPDVAKAKVKEVIIMKRWPASSPSGRFTPWRLHFRLDGRSIEPNVW